jgi:hypothetical protein
MFPSQGLQKYTKIGIWYENIPSGDPGANNEDICMYTYLTSYAHIWYRHMVPTYRLNTPVESYVPD